MEKNYGLFIFCLCSTAIVHLFIYTWFVYIINNLLHFRSNLNTPEHNMNKPKRSPTLDAFVIKKSKNILTVSSDFDQQEKSIENVV